MELHTWDQRGKNRVVKVEQKSEQALGREIAVPGTGAVRAPGSHQGAQRLQAGEGREGRGEPRQPRVLGPWGPGILSHKKRKAKCSGEPLPGLTHWDRADGVQWLPWKSREKVDRGCREGHWEHLANGDTGLAGRTQVWHEFA